MWTKLSLRIYTVIMVVLHPYLQNSCHGLQEYKSCADIKKQLGARAANGEYVIFLWNKVGVTIYCNDMKKETPKEYITLHAGKTYNYALFYRKEGYSTSCGEKRPLTSYQGYGKSEFSKIRIDLSSLSVDLDDYQFASRYNTVNKIRYATAGDKYAYTKDCPPNGKFQIDLTGTPFAVTKATKWVWSGRYADKEEGKGHANVDNNVYLGCVHDPDKRLLPGSMTTDHRTQTSTSCIQHCRDLSYSHAGTKHGSMCHCGNMYGKLNTELANSSLCNSPCTGNSSQMCGGALYISLYSTAVPQRYTGRCGGYPGECYPVTEPNNAQPSLKLDLMNGEHICVKSNPCQNEGRCIAVNSKLYKCQCFDGYSGIICETVTVTVTNHQKDCPPGYQAEVCRCQEPTCNGAMFEGDKCLSSTGKFSLVCSPGHPRNVILYNVDGQPSVRCPEGAEMVSCNYWTSYIYNFNYGQADIDNGTCTACRNCKVQARCKEYVCGCENGGHCNKVTFQCECPQPYFGEKCEIFDYCAHYQQTHNNTSPCTEEGICAAVPKDVVRAVGGDREGDFCTFPFDYKEHTFNSCVEDNIVGPPFACAANFDKSSSYIDLGKWSPGPSYTLAAWVRPGIVDNIRRTVAGGVSHCNDFGFNLNSGTFRGFLKLSKECTRDLDTGEPVISVGQWYMVAISCNSTHATIFQNGESKDTNTVLRNNIPTSEGFRIGGEACCPNDFFHGLIKTVKVWNRALSNEEINRSMYTIGTKNSSIEALHDGLVGHWELGETGVPGCSGSNAVDHGGEDWILTDGQFVSGIHCNIGTFTVPRTVTVNIVQYNGSTGGTLDITAQSAEINGVINGEGTGYRGGVSSDTPGETGQQGESYTGSGSQSTQQNHGGGGGGMGGNQVLDGKGRAGGGGGYAFVGAKAYHVSGDKTGLGQGGQPFGDADLNILYLGAGGGSGGNAQDLSSSPKGGRGGSGGGAIKIVAQKSILVTGDINMKGQAGQGDTKVEQSCTECPPSCNTRSDLHCYGNSTSACWDLSGPGGGGSGGSIYLSAKFVSVDRNKLWAMGGSGGIGASQICGGHGGLGRISIYAVRMKGFLDGDLGNPKVTALEDKFVDHSQPGQKQIDYRTTKYGNEVYRGCYRDDAKTNGVVLSVKLSLTGAMKRKMTPWYCQNLCRQKNFRFSGTRNGMDCFCDNHLDTSRKGADSNCVMACEGDPLQHCGGQGWLQVFGPPPGAPARGYNVVPKCESWCVTKDAGTPQPKWGQCMNAPATVADWSIQCRCPPGKTGQLCDQPCPQWKYGDGCRRNCTCNVTNTAECNTRTGICSCKPGYDGVQCESTCHQGTYGQNCKSSCSCSQNSVCDHVTGECSCMPGWSGVNCNFPCPANMYGSGCTLECNCNHGICSPEHGQCQCQPGYKLPVCKERCDNFTYGPDCGQKCDCNKQPCDPITGACQCSPGYVGPKCNILCPFGMWGQYCMKECKCSGFGCDHVDGTCQCGPGFQGDNCALECPHGSYGQGCVGSCTCVMSHTRRCNTVSGTCSCKDGYYGVNCELRCQHGYYGAGCSQLCQCYNGATCDHKTGQCSCAPGFIGLQCDKKCPAGKYGIQCERTCATRNCPVARCSIVDGTCHNPCRGGVGCNCPNNTWGTTSTCNNMCGCVNGQCDGSTGNCKCSPGWRGQHCQLPCPNGNYGQGCLSVCKCVNGKCDPSSGQCICSAGYNGTSCDAPCTAGTYGSNCRYKCPTCGAHSYSYPGCDSRSGSCLCSDGYTGPLCDRPCPLGNYGTNCSSQCQCENGAICDSVSGTCLCNPGYIGPTCDKTCPEGSWGLYCAQSCDCGLHGSSCTPTDGRCLCKPGFTGARCRESCPVSTYGQNCSSQCRCPAQTSMCSPIDGSCLCKPGFKGALCDAVCDQGYWGHECTQRCQCNGRGVCHPFSGACDCEAGYKGRQCETQCEQDIYWGRGCKGLCSCNEGHCNHRNGVCSCPPGKTGQHCEQDCDSRHFGFNCASTCQCENDASCNRVSGECLCKAGWTGPACNEVCLPGMYGSGCLQECPDCQNGASCDPRTGLCLCLSAYSGPLCNVTVMPDAQPHTSVQKLSSVSGIHFTVPQLAGLIVGFMMLLLLAIIIAVVFTRWRYVGRFGGTSGAVKFTSDEVDLGQRPLEVTGVPVSSAGFDNPVSELPAKEEVHLEGRQTMTPTTGATCMVDSDDDDSNYFKDSSFS